MSTTTDLEALSAVEDAAARATRAARDATQRPRAVNGDVEDLLVWALCEQRAHLEGYEPRGVSLCGVAQVERAMQLGAIIRNTSMGPGGGFRLARQCHPAAEAIYNATRLLDWRAARLVRLHAIHAGRPDWIPEGTNLLPVLDDQGVVRVCRRYDRNRNKTAEWCPLEYDHTPAEVRRCRAEYVTWWRALDQVKWWLRGVHTLGVVVATGPAAPERPWRATTRFSA